MTNEFGLDVSYFENKLTLLLRDLSRYTPAELQTELTRMVETASPADGEPGALVGDGPFVGAKKAVIAACFGIAALPESELLVRLEELYWKGFKAASVSNLKSHNVDCAGEARTGGSMRIGSHHLFKVRSAWGALNGVDVYSVDSDFSCPECGGESFTLHKTEYSDIKCRCCGEPIKL